MKTKSSALSKATYLAPVLAALMSGIVLAQEPAPVVVNVEGGQVAGTPADAPGITVFRGIPYAGPHGGENRWKPPTDVVPWEGVLHADTWGFQTVQPINGNPVGTFWGDEFYFDRNHIPLAAEHDLNLNVYAPRTSENEKLPVFVLLYGGGNHHGHASEVQLEASRLAEKGIIVVAPQYRVGPFGFMAHPDLTAESANGASGNYAILDLVKSLEWVRDNIEAFGGDPSLVTVGGQSAGAENATSLLRTPLADGLFQRVVIQSGFTGIFPGKFAPLAEKEAKGTEAVAAAFGAEASIESLRALPIEAFTETVAPDGKSLVFDTLHGIADRPFYATDGYVFTEDSIDLMADAALNGIDILIGGTSNEYGSLTGDPEATLSAEDFKADMLERFGEGAADLYPAADDSEARRSFLRARADNLFQGYLVSAEYAQAHNDDVDIYTYYFDQAVPGPQSDFYGAYHSSDLWYFYNSMREGEGYRPFAAEDMALADTMSSYLVNFVKTGNPNGDGLPLWDETSAETNAAFMRFTDGKAVPSTDTGFPERDAFHRAGVMNAQKLEAADVGR